MVHTLINEESHHIAPREKKNQAFFPSQTTVGRSKLLLRYRIFVSLWNFKYIWVLGVQIDIELINSEMLIIPRELMLYNLYTYLAQYMQATTLYAREQKNLKSSGQNHLENFLK